MKILYLLHLPPPNPLLDKGYKIKITNGVFAGKVYDGDTITQTTIKIADLTDRGEIWPNVYIRNDGIYAEKVGIRFAGVDTPEINRGNDKQRTAATAAKDFVDYWVKKADHIHIENVGKDKYFGRVVADVYLVTKNNFVIDIDEALIFYELGKPYTGGTKPKWDFD